MIRISDGDVSWGNFLSTPSCSLAGGQATHFFVTFRSRWSNSCATLQRRCWPFSHSITSWTLLLDGSPQKTPGSATIVIMLRWGEILDTTNHDWCSYRHSSCTPKQRTGQRNTINGGASISNCWRHRGGENWKYNSQFQTQPPVHILCPSLPTCISERHSASKLLCWLDADQGAKWAGRLEQKLKKWVLNFLQRWELNLEPYSAFNSILNQIKDPSRNQT